MLRLNRGAEDDSGCYKVVVVLRVTRNVKGDSEC